MKVNLDGLFGFPMTKIESAGCTQADGGNRRFTSVDRFIVRVPANAVVAVAIQVDQYRVELGTSHLFASLAEI